VQNPILFKCQVLQVVMFLVNTAQISIRSHFCMLVTINTTMYYGHLFSINEIERRIASNSWKASHDLLTHT